MGFLDKLKGTAKQAVNPTGQAAERDKQSLHDATRQGIEAGKDVIVKIDPDDPQSLLVWGAAS